MPKGISVKRKFGDKVFTYRTIAFNKKKADEIADTIRKAGKLARVVKSGQSYLIYGR